MLGRFLDAAVGALGLFLVWQAGWLATPHYLLGGIAVLVVSLAMVLRAFR